MRPISFIRDIFGQVLKLKNEIFVELLGTSSDLSASEHFVCVCSPSDMLQIVPACVRAALWRRLVDVPLWFLFVSTA